MRLALQKAAFSAEQEPPADTGEAPQPPAPEAAAPLPKKGREWGRAAATLGLGTLGFGAGMAAGYGGALALENYAPTVARRAMVLAPLLGAGAGLAYNLWKQKEMEEIKDALKNPQNATQR